MKEQKVLQEEEKLTSETVLIGLWQTQDDVAQQLLRLKSETKKKGGTENSTKISEKCPPTAVFGYISISFFQEGSGSIFFNNPQGEFIKTH